MIIYGHRGAKGEAPENTISGFSLASRNGIRHFELDVQLSKDNKLMVLHDIRVDRTTDRRGKISEFTSSELSKMDARRNVAPWPTFQMIPSLENVMENSPDCQHFQFEVKTERSATGIDRICKELDRLFKEKDYYQNASVTSSDTRILKKIKQINPNIKTGLVAEYRVPNPVKKAKRLGCHHLCAKWTIISPKIIEEAKKDGMAVSAWTVNRIQDVVHLKRMGIDSVITDYPTSMLAYFDKHRAES